MNTQNLLDWKKSLSNLVTEAKQEKTLMLNKTFYIWLLLFIGVSAASSAQDSREMDREQWKEIKERIRYGKKDPQGTGKKWTYSDIEWEKLRSEEGEEEKQYEERRVAQRTINRNNTPPRSNLSFSSGWATFFYILIAAILLAIIAYLIIKNYKKNPKVEKVSFEEELEKSPQEISITELQRLLQQALKDENFREAVRIYFIFILKELSERKWIDWKKDKTNLSYLREMRSRKEFPLFKTAVNIFDVVWYGNDHLERSAFEVFEPELKKMHEKLGIK